MPAAAKSPEYVRRFRGIKALNFVLCIVIFFLGLTAFQYKAAYEGSALSCLREMTVDGTIFSSLVALICAVMSVLEFIKGDTIHLRALYYLRLSSVVTGLIILLVVLIGYLPFVPATPVIARYDMINMHVLVPLLTIVSFCFNDTPHGKLSVKQRLGGLLFLLIYTIGIESFIISGIVPVEKIPYFFLDILHQPLWLTLFAIWFIYTLGFLSSWLFSELNRKLYTVWYRGTDKKSDAAAV